MIADAIKKVWDRVTFIPADYYLERIKNGDNFSFSRWGDGENLCMFHADDMGVNCDGSIFLKALSEPLKDALRHSYHYYRCLIDCSFGVDGETFANFLNNECPNTRLYYGEVWQEKSFGGKIGDIIDALCTRKLLFVGNKNLNRIVDMKGFVGGAYFIEIPDVNAFTETDTIIERIKDAIINKGVDCVCFSAGYATKVWIDMLYPEFGHKAAMIDFGSVFSPYCGDLNRSGMVSLGKSYFQNFTNYQL